MHHREIFWSWHQLYAEGKRIADPWLSENLSCDVQNTSTSAIEHTAEIKIEVFCFPASTEKAVSKENVSNIYIKDLRKASSLTFEIEPTALVDGVAIGGSEDEKVTADFHPGFLCLKM